MPTSEGPLAWAWLGTAGCLRTCENKMNDVCSWRRKRRVASLGQRRWVIGELAQVDQKIGELGVILDASKGHLVAGDVGPRIVQILGEFLEGPIPGMGLHGLRV